MELVALAILLAVAAAAMAIVFVVRRRRTQRRRLMGAEMAALDERISERLAELVGRGRRRPEPAAMTTNRSVTTTAPEPVPVIEPEPVAMIVPEPWLPVPAPSLPVPAPLPPAVPEPVAMTELEPVAEPEPVAVTDPEPIPDEPPLPAPSPVTAPQKPRPIRIGRTRPQAVAGVGRTRRRLLPRYVLAALVVIALFVVVGGQLLGRFPSSGAATPSPTEVSGAVPTGTSDLPTPAATPTETPTATPLPTASVGGSSPTPRATPFVYIVRRGDTMSNIAEAFGVTLTDLIAANPQIEDPSLIYAGNVITLPPGASPTAPPAP
jgi:LysM repeat protein